MENRDFNFSAVRRSLEPHSLGSLHPELEDIEVSPGRVDIRHIHENHQNGELDGFEESKVVEAVTETPGESQEYTEIKAYLSPNRAEIYTSPRYVHSDTASGLQSLIEEIYPETVEGELPKDRKGYEVKF